MLNIAKEIYKLYNAVKVEPDFVQDQEIPNFVVQPDGEVAGPSSQEN